MFPEKILPGKQLRDNQKTRRIQDTLGCIGSPIGIASFVVTVAEPGIQRFGIRLQRIGGSARYAPLSDGLGFLRERSKLPNPLRDKRINRERWALTGSRCEFSELAGAALFHTRGAQTAHRWQIFATSGY